MLTDAKRSVELEIFEMQQVFKDAAVRVVARDGLDKVTTKAIAREAKLNEAYIYKCFENKDDLLNEALNMEDANFAVLQEELFPVIYDERLSYRERAYVIWKRSWDFILEERDDCIFYIRFYFASIGLNHVYRKHMDAYWPLVERVRPLFKEGTNMEMLCHQVFCTMLLFAARVMDGDLENNEETTQWVFNQIDAFVTPNVRQDYFQKHEE